MKHFFKKTFCVFVCVVVFAFSLVGCKSKNVGSVSQTENRVVITVLSSTLQITSETTLLDYMNKLQQNGELSFDCQNGMITEINGVKNTLSCSSCWMLYTSDTEFSNNEWGTVEYDGKNIGSAKSGVAELKIKDGEIYVWEYVTF